MHAHISATFTADLMEPALRLALNKASVPLEAVCKSYGQVLQAFQAHVTEPDAIHVFLIRLEDWAPGGDGDRLLQNVELFLTEFQNWRAESGSAVLVCLCPASKRAGSAAPFERIITAAADRLEKGCRNIRDCIWLDAGEQVRMYGVVDWDDEYLDRLAHIPYTELFFHALGLAVARALYRITALQTKLVIVDADNTLWQGVCGETASCELLVQPRHLALQKKLLEQSKMGRLICLCSHNNLEDVERVFEERPDMPLRLEDFHALRVSWLPKTELISTLLSDFQTAPESVVFLDDDPLQCARVNAEWPQMAALVWPVCEIEARRVLDHFWPLDASRQTVADSVRSEFFRTDFARQQVLRDLSSPKDLLRKLELKIDIFPLHAPDLDRSAQLTARTTQFNLSPVRLTSAQIQRLQKDECWAGVRVRDRFGDYGQVGLIGARPERDKLCLHTFLLSCRALSRGVEYEMAAWVGKLALKRGLPQCLVEWRATERNYPARAFLEQVKSDLCVADDTGDAWLVSSLELSQVKPAVTRGAISLSAERSLDADLGKEVAGPAAPDWQQLVVELSTAVGVKKALTPAEPSLTAELTSMSPAQQALSEIWQEVLGVTDIDQQTDFFSLGGHSLLATQIMARIRDVFGVELGLEALFEAPTISELSGLIMGKQPASQRKKDIHSTGPLPEPELLTPLASAQERFFVLEEYYEAPGLGNVPLRLRLDGVLDAAALAESLFLLAVRHEALRAKLVRKGGELWQVIGEESPVRLNRSDLTALAAAEQQKRVELLAREEARAPFDPELDDLIRAHLIGLTGDDHVLLVTVHHSVLDAASQNILMNDLGVIYASLASNTRLQLKPPRSSFRAFAAWEGAQERQRQWPEHRVYWRNQLRGAQPPFADRIHRNTPGPVGIFHFQVHQALADAARVMASQARTTEYVVCLSALSLALHDMTGRSDIVIGAPTSIRPLTEFNDLVGCFLNTLPIRIQGLNEFNLEALLKNVNQTTRDALARAEFPLEEILAAQVARSGSDLIQVIFQLRHEPLVPPEMPGLATSFLPSPPPFARLPLSFTLAPDEQGVQAVVEFAADRFDVDWIARLAERYVARLQSLVGPAAGGAILRARIPGVRNGGVRRELLSPPSKAVAVRCGQQSISYDQLHDFSEALAASFRNARLGPGSRVGLAMERGVELVVGLIACLKVGAAFVILDPVYPRSRLDFMIADAELAIILTTAKAVSKYPLIQAATILDVDRWSIDALPTRRTAAGDATAAYIYYTSGSTGKPKGALCARSSLDNLINWFIDEFDLGNADGSFVPTSPSFDLTLKNLLAPLMVGGSITLFDGADYEFDALLKSLSNSPATWMNTTPTALDLILREASISGYAGLCNLRYLFSGGEALQLDRLRDWAASPKYKTEIVNTYGPTECSGIAGFARVPAGDWRARQIAPIGAAVGNVTIAVLTKTLSPTSVGEVGEVHIGGAAVGLGYWNRRRETAEKFLPDPERPGERRYRTGDLARVLPGGQIELIGRSDFQVKVRGHRIELGEVEAVLASHPDIEAAAAFTTLSETGTELRIAYLAASGITPRPSALRAHLAAALPSAAVPSAMYQIDFFPRTPSGKLDRLALARAFAGEGSEAVQPVGLTDLERQLAQLWTDVLKVAVESSDDDFFVLGGHSLLASRLVHLVHKEIKVKISIRTVFDHPTLSAMATAIQDLRSMQTGTQVSARQDHAS